jgi:hypothetical protein
MPFEGIHTTTLPETQVRGGALVLIEHESKQGQVLKHDRRIRRSYDEVITVNVYAVAGLLEG